MTFRAGLLSFVCCALAGIVLIGGCPGIAGQGTRDEPFSSPYAEADVFIASIAAAKDARLSHRRVSGLTVPHHLLAAELIAKAFTIAEQNRYDKIVILSPDHFKRARRPFATTRRSFETVFGRVETSASDTSRLLADARMVDDSALFAREHGIGALLPYVKHFFPDTPIVPIAVSIKSTRAEWERLVADLDEVITAKTLILQSTDFSHYLSLPEAIQRDQEVLNVIAANDLESAAKLRQPAHLDSRGSQYLQMRLQAQHFGARPVVIFNANSQAYSGRTEPKTTSYIVQIYPAPEYAELIDSPDASAAKTFCFAGDTFFGRYMRKLISRPEAAQRLAEELQTHLGGCPLVVNLEGVAVVEMPEKIGPLTLAMPEDLTLSWLKSLNVVAVSVANNHAMDLGKETFDEMVATLEKSGLKVLRHGDIVDLGPFRLVALTDLDNNSMPYRDRVGETDLDAIGRSDALPPLVAFLHWGKEFQTAPDQRQVELASELRRRGVSLTVGAHPHRALPHLDALAGGEALVAYSLGNFLFDQLEDRASGSILEVRFFPQGTFFARLVPMPNFYQVAHELRRNPHNAGQ